MWNGEFGVVDAFRNFESPNSYELSRCLEAAFWPGSKEQHPVS